jgi:lactate dehydrogenase-like 2-hydroxyacid dehydrogenase
MPMPVIMPYPMTDHVIARIEAKLPLVRLWEAEGQTATIREVSAQIRGMAAAPHSTIDAALMDQFPNLEIIASLGVGYDTVDTRHAADRHIVVTHTPGVLSEDVADLAIGLMLSTTLLIHDASRRFRAQITPKIVAEPLMTLRGRTLGILGLRRTGKAIARRCEAFGLKIGYYGRTMQESAFCRYFSSVHALAEASDILMVVAPGLDATKGLVNASVLEALGSEGVLINVGRGSVVDEKALIEALRRGVIRSAGLDIYPNEPNVPPALIALDHVVLLSHMGLATQSTRRAMHDLVVDNLLSWAAGNGALTSIPETSWASNLR